MNNFTYLYMPLRKKLKKAIKTWELYKGQEKIIFASDPKAIATFDACAINDENIKFIFSKEELDYLAELGFISIINTTNNESHWATLVEPTYSGVHYSSIAFTNLLGSLMTIITFSISVASFVLSLIK